MDLTRISVKYGTVKLRIVDADGAPALPSALYAALLPPRTAPTGGTTWRSATYEPYDEPDADGYTGESTLLFAGPDASADGSLAVPEGGADLFVRADDTPEVDAALVDRITVA